MPRRARRSWRPSSWGSSCRANYAATRELDWSLVVEVSLVTLLGAVSLKVNDTRFFKFQPTVTGVMFALYLAYHQFFDEPFMVKMASRMGKLTPKYQSSSIVH